jgi:phenylacetate-CoA ligase
MSINDLIYKKSPIFLQNIACTVYGYKESRLRFGGKFDEYYHFLLDSQWLSEENIRTLQEERLSKMVAYSYKNIPYYNKLFKNEKLLPSDIVTINDLEKIPILTKEKVRLHYSELINPNYKESVIRAHTSGSTGKALDFLFSKDAVQYRWALWSRHKARFNVEYDDSYATFTGLVAIPIEQSQPPYWRENYAMNQTVFTMHHITTEKAEAIVDRLNQGGFVYYSGYPSILYLLATIIENEGLEITAPPRVIFTGAETLLEEHKFRISKVFKCIVTDQYGFSEGAGNASSCEYGVFHEDFEYGILECLNKDKHGLKTSGDVIGTGFTNLAMPFIRYQVEDRATWTLEKCKCGRNSKVLTRVEGRSEDYIITPEGGKILRFDYIFKGLVNIQEAQVVQYNLGSITINIVKRDSYSTKDEELLVQHVRSKISPMLNVKFNYVDEIERETTGKFRAVRSYLKKQGRV